MEIFRLKKIMLCEACGNIVAKKARTCPHCGLRLRSGTGCLQVAVLGAVTFLAAVVFLAFFMMKEAGDGQLDRITEIARALPDEGISGKDVASVIEMVSGADSGDEAAAAGNPINRAKGADGMNEVWENIFRLDDLVEDSEAVRNLNIARMVAEVEEAEPYEGTPAEEVSQAFGVMSGATDLDREAVLGDIRDRVVLWNRLKLKRVDKYETAYFFMTAGTDDRPGTILKVYRSGLSLEDRQYIGLLEPGDLITAKGKVSGTFIGPDLNYIVLNPVVLVR